jgi:hypothetical protein
MSYPRSRVLLPALVLSLGAAAFSALPAVAEPAGPVTLDQATHGRAAVRALGDRLDDAAELNDQQPAELRELLLEDSTAWLDTDANIFFKDTTHESAAAAPAATSAAATYPLSQTFRLHSLPGSQRTIYLDFDGQTVSGTTWNTQNGVSTAAQPAWSLDSSPAFSDAEQTAIQSIWERVAEDYAPFNVDVTTQDPGTAAIARTSAADLVYGTRALITPSTQAENAICGSGGGCGGVAYLDVFDEVGAAHEAHQPAWIFPQQLGNDTKSIAESIAHEVGHNLALRHDGNASSDYDTGHGIWAPIMGTGYDAPVVQWSKGDYTGANNQEDDLALITGSGLSYRADEAGSTVATAAAGLPDVATYISQRTDVDVYALGTCSGTVSVAGLNAPTSPDLDLQLRLLDASGTAVATASPASLASVPRYDVTTGTDATVSARNLPSGAYFVEVDGVGNGTWATGYDDYGSLGAYTLTASGLCDGMGVFAPPVEVVEVAEAPAPEAAPVVAAPSAPRLGAAFSGRKGRKSTAGVRWRPPTSAGGSTITGYQVTVYRLNVSGRFRRTADSAVLRAELRKVELRLGRGRYRFTVQAMNSAGVGPVSKLSKVVRAR